MILQGTDTKLLAGPEEPDLRDWNSGEDIRVIGNHLYFFYCCLQVQGKGRDVENQVLWS